ncbi:N-acetylmuramoyl-L-alanine amidase [Streptomyces sp. NPDC001250]|uniref:peptidoglycan recognition protein family protein n=1 Tax=Streptomyces sp. NPDC001250 TaxID=3154382 RepID=UPI00332B9A65
MRGFLTSSIGVTCATALALPLTLPATTASAATATSTPANAATATSTSTAANASTAANLATAASLATTAKLATAVTAIPRSTVRGSTRSLPLAPLTDRRVLGVAPVQGLYRPDGEHFSLLGVVWNDPDTELRGRVQVRTRSAATGEWSGWQDVETHNADHGPDPGTAERTARRVRGATAPLWVGAAEGVDVRVRADDTGARSTGTGGPRPSKPSHPARASKSSYPVRAAKPSHPSRSSKPSQQSGASGASGTSRTSVTSGTFGTSGASHPSGSARPPLPSGLRLELVDPGKEVPSAGAPPAGASAAGAPADRPHTDLDTDAAKAASTANTDIAPFGAREIPALGKKATEQELARLKGPVKGKPYIGPRPRIVTRRGWGADESLRDGDFAYTKKIKAVFVHHTASGNKYSCSQADSVIRSIYRYHVTSMGWRDMGYNFLVDKCGTIYEGRAGGVAKAVLGAHTLGFNNNSMGIAVIGTYGTAKPSGAAVKAIARLTAWKLGLYGGNPRGKTYLTSSGGNRYAKGKKVRLNVISGHRDGFATECPGARLYGKLGTARSSAAHFQGR